MPVKAAARHIEITDHRLWRIVHQYVEKAVGRFDSSQLKAIGLNEIRLSEAIITSPSLSIWNVYLCPWFLPHRSKERSLDEIRKPEHRDNKLPKNSCCSIRKKWSVSSLMANQYAALLELIHSNTYTSVAWMVKVKLLPMPVWKG